MQIDARSDFLRIRAHGERGEHLDFHWFWLRHNCDCCRHPQTRERTLCSSSVALGLRPSRVTASPAGDAVEIEWDEAGGHRSVYAIAWLERHAYARGHDAVAPPPGDDSMVSRPPRSRTRCRIPSKPKWPLSTDSGSNPTPQSCTSNRTSWPS